jgi:hypothetical protein
MVTAMKEIAQSRSRERMSKASLYAAFKLRSRLSAKDEEVGYTADQELTGLPSYLRRKPLQGKGDV